MRLVSIAFDSNLKKNRLKECKYVLIVFMKRGNLLHSEHEQCVINIGIKANIVNMKQNVHASLIPIKHLHVNIKSRINLKASIHF